MQASRFALIYRLSDCKVVARVDQPAEAEDRCRDIANSEPGETFVVLETGAAFQGVTRAERVFLNYHPDP